MAGCRSLTDEEVKTITDTLQNKRDKCLFVLGVYTGFRVSELLSITIGDIYKYDKVVDRLKVMRKNMKGKMVSRDVALHPKAQAIIKEYLLSLKTIDPSSPLFHSKKGGSITRFRAHGILKDAYKILQLEGSLATHSLRKTFAENIYKNSNNDLRLTQLALNHANIQTTVKYLSPSQDEIDSIVLGQR